MPKLGKKNLLEIIVFLSGAIVMILEVAGARAMSPYVGTSMVIWTSIIGIILGALSFGYWYGGKLADKKPTYKNLAYILLFAAIAVTIMIILKDIILIFLDAAFSDLRVKSVLGSVLLFALPSMALGMVSPYTVKLKMQDLDHSGETVGRLYALSTVGSITGTFVAGFWLIPFLGTTRILIGIALALFFLALFVSWNINKKVKFGVVAMIMFAIVWQGTLTQQVTGITFVDIDTQYNRVWVYDTENADNEKMRVMSISNPYNQWSSGIFLEKDELAFEYLKYYDLISYFVPDFQETLMIGGAGYAYPQKYLAEYPIATIDVVEIDPGLTEIAKKYFGLEENKRLKTIHEDGRVFLNTNEKKYDTILIDAFGSFYSIPYQLTTKEAVEKVHDSLEEDGVVIVNIISSLSGNRSKFLQAEYATYKKTFQYVYLLPVQNPDNGAQVQNVMLIATDKEWDFETKFNDEYIQNMLGHRWDKVLEQNYPVLTDEYAPVDHYIMELL